MLPCTFRLAALALALGVALVALPAGAADTAKGATAEADRIAWETSYSAALSAAESATKPIVFKFYTGWCPHCTRMDKTTWKDADVAQAAKSYVAAKINADVEKVPVKRYRLVGYPTVIVAEPGGEEVVRMEGYKDAKAISAVLAAYTRQADSIATAFKALAKDAGDPAANLSLGRFYSGVSLHAPAAERFLKALKSAQGEDAIAASTGAGACLTAAGDPKAAVKALETGLSAAGPQPPAPLLLAMGQAQAALERKDQARTWFDRVVAEHATSPEAETARKALSAL